MCMGCRERASRCRRATAKTCTGVSSPETRPETGPRPLDERERRLRQKFGPPVPKGSGSRRLPASRASALRVARRWRTLAVVLGAVLTGVALFWAIHTARPRRLRLLLVDCQGGWSRHAGNPRLRTRLRRGGQRAGRGPEPARLRALLQHGRP